LRIARNRNSQRCETEFIPNTLLCMRHERLEFAVTRSLVKFDCKSLHAAESFQMRAMQSRSDHALQRPEKKYEHEQQNARCRFGRQNWFKPHADAPDQREIEQREKCRRERIYEVPLRSELQKIAAQRVVNQQRSRKDARHNCSRREQVGEERPSSLRMDNA